LSSALPDVEWPPTREFWAAARRSELAIPRCAECGRYVWYPQETCLDCGGDELPWQVVSGRGSLFSWALVERALFKPFREKVPYVAGLIALEEDPAVRIVSNVVDCDPQELTIDMPVRAVFRDLSFPGSDARVCVPQFVPASVEGEDSR
jgi:uncharacterized OB-fold protein